ncbi:hypothetical protein ABKN59_004577 [Abortiporus biennis]
MVHRPADSRLLVNLLAHEKDYSKQLTSLLDYSQASLASFSAYASASAPPTSQVIISVAGAFAGADDALRKYLAAVEQWQLQLKALKELEADVGNVMRDREILVTRLIKASKSSKPSREGILGSSGSASTLSFSTKPEVHVGSKLSTAQMELQACEAHLAAKEKELTAFRISTIRTGLQVRCSAMAECGWVWNEMGKEGLRTLEMLDISLANGDAQPAPPVPYKPLPENYDQNSSDHSSLAPSQSASQIATTDIPRSYSPMRMSAAEHYTLQIPPAHAISEFALPNGTATQQIPEEDEDDGSSAGEGETQGLEMHENPRFSHGNKGKEKATDAPTSELFPRRQAHFPAPASDSRQVMYTDKIDRPRKPSVFGSIAAFFHHRKASSSTADRDRSPSPTKSKGWHTRTDKNLAKAKRGDDSSDDEAIGFDSTANEAGPSIPSPTTTASPNSPRPATPNHARLKKRSKRSSVQVTPSNRPKEVPEEKGYLSDGAAGPNVPSISKGKRFKTRDFSEPEPSSPSPLPPPPPPPPNIPSTSTPASKPPPKKKMAKPGALLTANLSTEAHLSRNSSMSKNSIMSAPAPPGRITTIHPTATSVARNNSVNSTSSAPPGRRRSGSLDITSSHKSSLPKVGGSLSTASGKVLSGAGYPSHPKKPSLPPPRANGAADPGRSLMSIVEGVSKNREDWLKKQDPNRMLVMAKAPPPVTDTLDLSNLEDDIPPVPPLPHSTQLKSPPVAGGSKQQLSNGSAKSTPTASLNASLPIPLETRVEDGDKTPKPSFSPERKMVPLRSALRNSSRSPSPNSITPKSSPPQPIAGTSRLRSPPINGDLTPIPPSSWTSLKRKSADVDDVSSLSSYETTQEVFEDDYYAKPDSPPSSSPPPPPPSHEKPTPTEHIPVLGSDLSTTSTATSGGSAPARRKSVRMSLPPTFSATPPALDDDDDAEQRAHEPWSSPNHRHHRTTSSGPPSAPAPARHSRHIKSHSWSSRIAESKQPAPDVWADSSDEDEEYRRAKRLLSKMSRKH